MAKTNTSTLMKEGKEGEEQIKTYKLLKEGLNFRGGE